MIIKHMTQLETKDWREEFEKQHPMKANETEFGITVYNFAMPHNLIDFIQNLLDSHTANLVERILNWTDENSKELSDPYPFDSKYTYFDFVSV